MAPVVQYIYGEHYNFTDIAIVNDYGVGLAFDYRSPIGPITVDFGYSSIKEKVVINLGLGYRHIL